MLSGLLHMQETPGMGCDMDPTTNGLIASAEIHWWTVDPPFLILLISKKKTLPTQGIDTAAGSHQLADLPVEVSPSSSLQGYQRREGNIDWLV